MNNPKDINVHLSIDLTIQNDQLFPLFSFLSSIESKSQSDQTPASEPSPKRRGRPRIYSDEERKERHKARCRIYNDAHREEINSRMRYIMDRRRNSHVEGYVPTSDYKKDFRISDVTSDGYLYLAFDQATNAYKIGMTQCTPETRLAQYQSKDSDTITFLQRSPLLEDVAEAEDNAHQMLRGHVTFVRTDDKTTPSSNPCAEWMQLDRDYDLGDVKAIFDGICELYAKDAEVEREMDE